MKFFFIISFLFFLAISTHAKAQDNISSENFMLVQMLIKMDLDDNFKEISEKSNNLTEYQKLVIYDEKNIPSVLPFALNFLPGFGIGSWMQGDIIGGMIGTFGTAFGVIAISAGLGSTHENSVTPVLFLIFLGSKVVDSILPFTYASSYNSKLKKALGFNSYTDFIISPSINSAGNGRPVPALALHIGF